MILAPIVIFVYNRPVHTQKVVEALQKNSEAAFSNLFIFSDAPKNEEAKEKVEQVRQYIKSISGFKSITIKEQDVNLGLADSIISGVTEIVNKFGKIIVLEDDIETSPHFLKFMNNALSAYENEKKIWSITGFAYPIKHKRLPEAFCFRGMRCWGWGTWVNRWKHFDKNPDKYIQQIFPKHIDRFNSYGQSPVAQLIANKNGEINTWAVFWYAEQFINNGFQILPAKSFVKNIGLDGSGVHCGISSDYDCDLIENEVKIDFSKIPVKENKLASKLICRYLKIHKAKESLLKKTIRRILGLKKIINKIKSICYIKYAHSPKVLQLPITYMCNFDCVMCGISEVKNEDFTSEELKKILDNQLFTEITSVGVNGGEPFMKKNLLDYISVLVETLPKLRHIHIITNGYFCDRIKNILPRIKSICDLRQIKLNIAVSVDAVGEKLDFHRGKKCAGHVEETIDFLLSKQGKKCYDNMNIICTITKYNVYDLPEVEVWAKKKHVDVQYNIATYHERVNNAGKFEEFTVLNDELAKKMAEEFFYKKYKENNSEKYFSLFYYLQNKKRIALCEYQSNAGVTLTPNRQLAYCATYSKELGDALITSADVLYKKNISYRKNLVKEKCKHCSHYSNITNMRGYIVYVLEYIKNRRLFH